MGDSSPTDRRRLRLHSRRHLHRQVSQWPTGTSVRALNVLHRAGIERPADLLAMNPMDLIKLRGCGRATMRELLEIVRVVSQTQLRLWESYAQRYCGSRYTLPAGVWLGQLTGSGAGLCHIFPELPGDDPRRLPHVAVCKATTGRGADPVEWPPRALCHNCKKWLDGPVR